MLASKIFVSLCVVVTVLAQDEPVEESRALEELEEARQMLEDFEAARMFEDDNAEEVRSLEESENHLRAKRQSGLRTYLRRLLDAELSIDCKKAGNKAVPADCRAYLSCRRAGEGVVKMCPKGDLFDPTELKCRSAKKVLCRPYTFAKPN